MFHKWWLMSHKWLINDDSWLNKIMSHNGESFDKVGNQMKEKNFSTGWLWWSTRWFFSRTDQLWWRFRLFSFILCCRQLLKSTASTLKTLSKFWYFSVFENSENFQKKFKTQNGLNIIDKHPQKYPCAKFEHENRKFQFLTQIGFYYNNQAP